MGRRSVNTTKSGKFMNPTDQARKEARKRELKKNKKQRMAVRHAVLKSKDPLQLLEETALYDKQEYDPNVQANLNERVLQEKRRKLLETFDRLVILYRKEDSEYAGRLQAARHDYDKRRHEMMLYYEQVKLAERVKASDIPLPKLPQSHLGLSTSEIPLPIGNYAKGILKKSLGLPGLPPSILPAGRKPPAPPPGPPPELSDTDGEDADAFLDARQRKIRFADVDTPHYSTEPTGASAMPSSATSGIAGGFSTATPLSQIPLPPPTALPAFTGLLRPSFPGAPQPNQIRFMFQSAGNATLSAPPSLHPRDPLDNPELVNPSSTQAVTSIATATASSVGGTIIEAKPQLKNLIGDATRFVPTALKVKRTVRDPSGRLITVGGVGNTSATRRTSGVAYDRISRGDTASGAALTSTTSKDHAYEEFMREMDGLL